MYMPRRHLPTCRQGEYPLACKECRDTLTLSNIFSMPRAAMANGLAFCRLPKVFHNAHDDLCKFVATAAPYGGVVSSI